MGKYRIIPIFIPHVGCPHDCVFCNQASITGALREDYEKITASFVKETIEAYLETIDRAQCTVEVSFFGGTFTGIDLRKQKELLAVAKKAKEEGKIDYIRLSTRPDYVDLGILHHLKSYGVDIIELGVQSMDAEVLALSKRGYGEDTVKKASLLIKEFGMVLGHQLMVGLPGDTFQKDLYTLEKSLALKPDVVRIYPALVIQGTEMAEAFHAGLYKPYALEEAVEISAKLLQGYQEAGAVVIRVGLQPTEEIQLGKEVLAGPFHPAFRELCEGYLLAERILQEEGDELLLRIGEKDLSKLYADKKRYFRRCLEKKKIQVEVLPGRLQGTMELRRQKKGGAICI